MCHIDVAERESQLAQLAYLASYSLASQLKLARLARTHFLLATLRAIISKIADVANVMTFDPMMHVQ